MNTLKNIGHFVLFAITILFIAGCSLASTSQTTSQTGNKECTINSVDLQYNRSILEAPNKSVIDMTAYLPLEAGLIIDQTACGELDIKVRGIEGTIEDIADGKVTYQAQLEQGKNDVVISNKGQEKYQFTINVQYPTSTPTPSPTITLTATATKISLDNIPFSATELSDLFLNIQTANGEETCQLYGVPDTEQLEILLADCAPFFVPGVYDGKILDQDGNPVEIKEKLDYLEDVIWAEPDENGFIVNVNQETRYIAIAYENGIVFVPYSLINPSSTPTATIQIYVNPTATKTKKVKPTKVNPTNTPQPPPQPTSTPKPPTSEPTDTPIPTCPPMPTPSPEG